MNEADLKKLLQQSITPVTSSNFNYRVQQGLVPKAPKKRHALSLDEPLLLILLFGSGGSFLLAFLFTAFHTTLLLIAFAGFCAGISMMLLNTITRKLYAPKQVH